MSDSQATYDDDLIERLIVRPYERTPRPPCSHPDLEDACIGHLWGRCSHRRYGGVDTRVAGLCATCGPFARRNSGGSAEDAGILTQSQTMPRPDWDSYFFEIARMVSTRATCPRASIGVVLVDKAHRIVATGFNGAPAGRPHCTEVGCRVYAGHCTNAAHAEQNAVRAAQATIATLTGQMFASLSSLDIQPYLYGPREICSECARTMVEAGITKEPKTTWPA